MTENYSRYIQVFRENRGILRASVAARLGIPRHAIYQMVKKGALVQEARGLYRLADLAPLGNPDLVQVALLIPKSVIFLISALYFHRLTTQVPHKIYIALPNHVKPPRIDYPPLRIFYPRSKAFSSGIEERQLDGVTVRIYSREKTIADCFKYRAHIGIDVAVEALKDYLRGSSPDASLLMDYARTDRVEKTMRPYVEALL